MTKAPGPARYRVIEAWLRERCATLPAGSLLPAESELAERFQVSRMTARQALQNLAAEGLIERRRGAGTFVAPTPLHRADSVLLSFTQDMQRRGMTASSRIVSAGLITSPAEAVQLGRRPDTWVVRIDRIRLADGVPVARERATLPEEFKAVLDHDLESGSLDTALTKLGRQWGKASGYVSARLASEDDAQALELEMPAALLVESRLVYDVEGRPVERTETAYVASRWVIDTGLYVPAQP